MLTAYSATLDKFLSPYGIFSWEEMEIFDRMEKEWKDNQPRYTFSELIKMFPEAKKIARREEKAKLKILKKLAKENGEYRERGREIENTVHDPDQRQFYKDWFDEGFNETDIELSQQIAKIKINLQHLDVLEGKKEKVVTNGVDQLDIDRAKQVPITNFYTDKLHKHNQLAVGRCPFHSEKTGSFTIYLKQNTFHCYGCNANGTVIDFIMRQNGITFLEAVKRLLK